jgi:hypothetical protein
VAEKTSSNTVSPSRSESIEMVNQSISLAPKTPEQSRNAQSESSEITISQEISHSIHSRSIASSISLEETIDASETFSSPASSNDNYGEPTSDEGLLSPEHRDVASETPSTPSTPSFFEADNPMSIIRVWRNPASTSIKSISFKDARHPAHPPSEQIYPHGTQLTKVRAVRAILCDEAIVIYEQSREHFSVEDAEFICKCLLHGVMKRNAVRFARLPYTNFAKTGLGDILKEGYDALWKFYEMYELDPDTGIATPRQAGRREKLDVPLQQASSGGKRGIVGDVEGGRRSKRVCAKRRIVAEGQYSEFERLAEMEREITVESTHPFESSPKLVSPTAGSVENGVFESPVEVLCIPPRVY